MPLPTPDQLDTFDDGAYLRALCPERADWYTHPELRRAAAAFDPLAFALIYLPHHLSSDETGNRITLSAFHVALCRRALRWTKPAGDDPKTDRSAWIAPRGSGKSTWGFLILPLWALAYGYRRYISAFADSGAQAEQHLTSLKMELDANPLLRHDFPDLCKPARRPAGTTVSDRQDSYVAKSGVAFTAKGIDSSTLGAKIGNQRPDLLLFDDIEPEESNYSAYQKDKRLATVVDAVFPMNLYAAVMFLGTTVMAGSIIDDLRRHATDSAEDLPPWPVDERIEVNYFDAIQTSDEGVESSLWPALWSLEFLQSIRRTRSYAKNFANRPAAGDASYWTPEDFHHADDLGVTRVLLEIDPAVTTKRTSDWTGIAIVGYSPPGKRCVVYHAEQVRLTGERLAAHVLRLLSTELGGRVRAVRIEVNQGGDLWAGVFRKLPVALLVHTSTESKEHRFAKALDYYQRNRVWHAQKLPALEDQMTGFPRGAHDDVADAVVAGVLYFLAGPRQTGPQVKRSHYVTGVSGARVG